MTEEQLQTSAKGSQTANSSLLDDILGATKLKPTDDGYSVTKKGVQAFIDELLKPEKDGVKITTTLVDDMIVDLDRKLSAQMDKILHNAEFQKLESTWKSLKYLVDKVDFRENIKVEILNASKQDLMDDFEDAPEIMKSGLYKTAYTAEYGQFGGQPYGLIVGNYEFTPNTQDLALLGKIASVATMSHAPFISAASSKFFDLDSYEGLPNLKDLKSIFESPIYTKWQSFRESEDSRNVGLALPRFMLRTPYGENTVSVKKFNYNETTNEQHNNFLWGNAAFTFAANIARSFANYRWSANIIGPQGGGVVEDLPVYNYESMGEIQSKIPTEVLISERREYELSEEGFMALTMRKGSDNAAFFSANSVQKPKFFGNNQEGKQAELNYKLGTQLPYTMIVSRLAHYIKVLQRENIGTWKERGELETELNTWLRQYIADQDSPAPGVRSRRPLRKAAITVADVEGDPGWYKVSMSVQPHFKYMGASFTLSLVGKLDKQ
ncbi:MAG: hypothetical protein RL154_985 [Pseudomonadota bacterium]